MTKRSANKKCILCGKNEATTREHFPFKAEMLRKIHRNKFPMPIANLSTGHFPPQGPNSEQFKPIYNLCKKCNGKTTHNFEKDFYEFHKYLTKQAICFIRKTELTRFNAIIDVEDKKHETYIKTKKYFAKILACQMDKKGYSISQKLRNMALNNKDDESFILKIFVNSIVKMKNWEQEGEGQLGFKFNIGFGKDNYKKMVEIDVTYGHLDYAFTMEVEQFPPKIKADFRKPAVLTIAESKELDSCSPMTLEGKFRRSDKGKGSNNNKR